MPVFKTGGWGTKPCILYSKKKYLLSYILSSERKSLPNILFLKKSLSEQTNQISFLNNLFWKENPEHYILYKAY